MASPQTSAPQFGQSGVLPSHWPPLKSAAFRFCTTYFVLYGLPLLLQILPFGGILANQWSLLNVAVGRWLILHVLHLPEHNVPPFTDRLDYFLFDMLLIGISIVAALVWSLVGRGRTSYSRAYVWCQGLVRLALAGEMFVYGWSKLLPYQFWGGEVPLFDLARPLGQLDPGRLLWAMMGFSRSYAIFAGACEWLGALLLCFRRTATLGAVILIGSLANVVMLNFAYDVPVKLHAANLLAMALFVAASDLGRLTKVLLLNQATDARPAAPFFRSVRVSRLTRFAVPAVAIFLAYRPLASMLPDLPRGQRPPAPWLYGIFEVDSAARNGTVTPPLLTDTTRWRRLVLERNGWAAVTLMSDSVRMFRAAIDTTARTIQLTTLRRTVGLPDLGPVDTLRLSYTRPDNAHLEVRGLIRGDSVAVWLGSIPATRYRLLGASHRWAW